MRIQKIKRLLLLFLTISLQAGTFSLFSQYEVVITSVTNVDCSGGSSGSISVRVDNGTGPYNYYLYKSVNFPFPAEPGYPVSDASNTFDFNGLSAGQYTIFVQDGTFQNDLVNQTITEVNPLNATVSITNELCLGANNGQLNFSPSGGSGSYEYSINAGVSWTTDNPITGLAPNNYDVEMRDANAISCTQSLGTYTVEAAQALIDIVFTLSSTDVTCSDSTNGTISITPDIAGAYEFSTNGTAGLSGSNWQAGETFSNLSDGTYHVWVRRTACGPVEELHLVPAVTIDIPLPLSVDIDITQGLTCYFGSDAILNAVASDGTPGYNYEWYESPDGFSTTPILPAETNITLPNIGIGYYSVRVTDNNGCISDAPIFFFDTDFGPILNPEVIGTIPDSISVDSKTATVTCPSGATGTISVTASGGTGALEYSLTGPDPRAYQATGDFLNLPGGTYTILVRDANGCVNSNHTIEVVEEDLIPPTVTCVGDQSFNVDPTFCTYTVSDNSLNPVVTDNCSFTVTNDFNGTATINGEAFPAGETTINWTIEDAGGNIENCSYKITVTDNEDPIITCVGNQTKNNDLNECFYTVSGIEFDPTVTSDNCGISSISNNFNGLATLAGEELPVGVNTIVWTIEDVNGNTNTCTFDVTVDDNEDPTISCVANQTRNASAGACNYTVVGAEFDPTATNDNCGIASVTNNFNGGATLNGAAIPDGTTITWTITDNSGNTAQCSFDVTVNDTENPTISCVADQTRNADPGVCTYTVLGVEFDPTATGDNCGIASVTNDFNGGATLNGAAIPDGTTITWTITDNSGNTAQCSFDVTVNDTQNPTINCVANQTRNASAGSCNYTVVGAEFDPTATNDNCGIASVTNDFNGGATLNGASIPDGTTITWTITDDSGNTAQCSFDVTVNDTQNPTITCVADQTRNASAGSCNYTVVGAEFDPVTATDNCIVASVTNDFNGAATLNGASIPDGTTITWTITDDSGNTAQCSFDVTVNDNEDPTISCVADQTRNADPGVCTYTVIGVEFDPTATNDNCGIASVINDFNGGATLNGASIPDGTTITWTITDNSGNTAQCSFDVTVNDTQNPTISCVADQTRNADPGVCTYTVVGVEFDPTATGDNCGITSVTNDFNGGATLNGASIPDGTTITWTITDNSGNTAQCSFDVTVNDTQNPTITCVADQTRDASAGSCNYTVVGAEFDPVTATDNCIVASVTNDFNGAASLNGASIPDGTTITWTITDDSGNTAQCSFDVTVNDNEDPTISCVADQTRNASAGTCNYTVVGAEFDPTATNDNCGIASVINDFNGGATLNGASIPDGTTITWTITDNSGNTAQCSFDVTVNDTQNPTISCVADQTRNADPGVCTYTVVGVEFDPTATGDNCGIASVTNDFNGGATLNGASIPDGTTITWTITDNSGNTAQCSFDVTVNDTQNPTINCVANQTRNASAGACNYTVVGAEFDPTATNDNCGIASVTNDFTGGATLNGASIPDGTTITWTITDDSGNTAQCSFDVTVNDNEDPTISCVADQTRNASAGACNYTVVGAEFDPTATNDNCGIASVTNNFNGGATLNGASIPDGTTITWTITDDSGNTAQCSFDVTVNDTENPTISCVADQTRNADPGVCTYTVLGVEFDPTATGDNCGIASVTNDFNGGATLNGAAIPDGTTITWTITDNSGNTAQCSFDVTVNDTQNPTINCVANQTRNASAGSCNYTVVGAEFDPTATNDNCGIASVTNDFNGGATLNGASIPDGTTITWTITDDSGNTAQCSFDVTVNDTQNPTITCVADQTRNASAGSCNYTVVGAEFDPVTATDNCIVASVTNDFNGAATLNGASIPDGTTITWTITDDSGNTAQCSFDVTVNDNEDPTISCVADQTRNADPGVCTYTVIGVEFDPTATNDNCGIASVINDFNGGATLNGASIPDGTTITWTITDNSGNTAQCSFDVTVNDTQNPTISCVADQTRNADPGVCTYTVVGVEFDPTATGDNCGITSVTNDFNGGATLNGASIPDGTTITWTITDNSGNTAQCSFDVTVNDTQNPTITCVADQTRDASAGSCNYTVVGAEFDPVTATDNCIVASVTNDFNGAASLNGASIPDGTTITWTITDDSGNTAQCSFDVTVNDNEDPTISCVADQTRNASAGTCNYTVVGAEFDPTATNDNCGIASVTNDFNGGATLNGASIPDGTTITWTITDNSGNTAQCSFDVTVNDTQNPTISCVADQTRNADPGVCTYTVVGVEFDPTATGDNCGIASVINDFNGGATLNGAAIPDGTTITWTITDNSGNTAQCSFDVTVNDTQNPTINCVANQTRNASAGACNYTVVGAEFDPTATNDNCGIASVTNDFTGGATLNGASIPDGTTITWTITDDSGNTAQCSFDVTVNDNEDPTISCVADQTRNASAGACNYTVVGAEFDPTATNDNCGIASVTNDFNGGATLNGASIPDGTTITWTITDDSGNTAQCSFDVTINDNEDPIINNCPADISVSNDAGNCDAFVNWVVPTASDNCPGVILVSTYNPGDVFNVGTTTVTYTATDAAGNTDVCSFDVTVTDNENPVINNVPANLLLPNGTDSCSRKVYWTEPTPTDNCNVQTFSRTFAPGDEFPVGTSLVEYTAIDNAGNSTTASFTVTIIDIDPPAFVSCPADITVDNDPGVCEASVTWTVPSVTDNCAGVVLTSSHNPGDAFPVGVPTVVTYTATDASGNIANCSFVVNVNDTELPNITCIPDPTSDADAGECFYTVSGNEFDPTAATDNCGVNTITNDINGTATLAGETFPVGVTTVIWTVEDIYGNTNTCSIDITVNPSMFTDISPLPAQVCPGVDLTLTGSITGGTGGFTHSWTENTPGTLTGATDQSTVTFNYAIPGTYRIYYTATDLNGCTAIDSIDVEVYPSVSAAPSPTPANVCPGDSIVLFGNPSGGDGNFTHNWSGPAGSLVNPVDRDSVVFSYTTSGLHTITYTVLDGKGCSTIENIDVNVYPQVTAAITPDPAEACLNTDYILDGNPAGGSTNFVTHLWSGPATSYTTPNNNATTTFNGDTPGTFELVYYVEDDNGCRVTDTTDVIVSNPPEAIAGDDVTVCYEDTEVQIPSADTNYTSSLLWTIFDGAGTFQPGTDNTINPIYIFDQADKDNGYVDLILTANGLGSCTADKDTIRIIIPEALDVIPLRPSPFSITANTIINVSFEIEDHIMPRDLKFLLVAPDGTEILLTDNDLPNSLQNLLEPINVTFSNTAATPFDYTDLDGGNTYAIENPGDWSTLYNNPAIQAADKWGIKLEDCRKNFPTQKDGFLKRVIIELRDTNALGEPVSMLYDSDVLTVDINEASTYPGCASTSYSPALGFSVSCFGECDAEISLSITGGAGTDSIVWRTLPGLTPVPEWNNLDMASLCAGDYNVKVYDIAGCVDSVSFNVATPNEIIIDSVSYSDTLVCAEDSAYVVVYANQAGFSGLTYTIDYGTDVYAEGDTAYFYPSADTAIITVYGKNNCAIDTILPVYRPEPLNFELISTTDVLCHGDSTGAIEIRATGGTAPYEFVLLQNNNGVDTTFSADTAIISSIPADSAYLVQITDNNGCMIYSDTIQIFEPTELLIDTLLITPILCHEDSATIEVVSSGGTPAYQYSIMGDTIANYQSDPIFTGIIPGNYFVWVMDANGCTTPYGDTVKITAPPAIAIDSLFYLDTLLCNGDTTSIQVFASGGSGALQYTIDGVSYYPVGTKIDSVFAGDYTIQVVDTNSCILDSTISIVEPDPISIIYNLYNISCKGDSTGIIEIVANNGTPDYLFTLYKDGNLLATETSADTATFMVTADSTYTVTIEDANGCQADFFDTLVIMEPATILDVDTVYISPIVCNGGTAVLEVIASGGTPDYMYSIMGDTLANYQADSLFGGLNPGEYYVWVRDANGCTTPYEDTILIADPPVITLDSIQADDVATCPDDNTGEIRIYVSGGVGPFEYSVDDGSTWQDSLRFVNLPADEYRTFVRDSLGCGVPFDTITLNEPAPINLEYDHTNISCNGTDDGTIMMLATGGTAPYTYEINLLGNPVQSQSGNDTVHFTNLVPGNYIISTYDANNCDTLVQTLSISEPPALNYEIYYTEIICHGDSTAMTIDVDGGVTPYYFTINNGLLTEFEDSSTIVVGPGLDTIRVYDDNGCIAGEDTIIHFTEPPEITLDSIFISDVKCHGDVADSVLISASAGSLTLQYSIDGTNFQADGLFTNQPGGDSITLYVRDTDRGCVKSYDTLIIQPEELIIDSIDVVNPTDATTSDGSIIIYTSGGTAPVYYSIDSADTFSPVNVHDNLPTGRYYIFVRDANGCMDNIMVNLDFTNINIEFVEFNPPSCNGFDDASITIRATSGEAPFTYYLRDMDGNLLEQTTSLDTMQYTFDTLTAGTYQIRATDVDGRTSNLLTLPLNDPDPVNFASIYISEVECFGNLIDTIRLQGQGGTGIFEYSVDGTTFQGGRTFNNIEPGALSLYVRDNNGCTYQKDTVATEPSEMVIDSVETTITSGPGIDDGTITVFASGGTGQLQYSIDGGSTFQTSIRFENLATGIYDIVVMDANGCTAQTTVEVSGLKVNITSIQPSCFGLNDGSIRINVSTEADPPILFSIEGEGNINNATRILGDFDQYDTVFTNLEAGEYEIYVLDANGRTFTQLYVLDQPEPLSLSATTTYAQCQISIDGSDIGTITLEVDGGTQPYTLNTGYQNAQLSDTMFLISELLAGTYTLQVNDSNECSVSDTFTVEPNPDNIISINQSTSPADFPVCYGTEVDLMVNPTNATDGFWVDLSTGGVISQTESYSFTLQSTRNIMFRAENDTAGCANEHAFELPRHPWLNLTLMEDTILLKETSTYLRPTLDTAVLENTTFRWIALTQPGHIDYLNDDDVAYPIFTAPTETDSVAYAVTAITEAGCIENDTIGIKIINTLKFPSGFTPNGDGANDQWILNEALLGRAKVEIFNRWGKRIFYSENYAEPWNGKFNNKDLPIGTYYYIVTVKVGEEETITGTVTIMR